MRWSSIPSRSCRSPPARTGRHALPAPSFWEYNPITGLSLEAEPGFLTTATGNGGFTLHVGVNGDWQLQFDGTNQTLGHYAGEPQPAAPSPPAGNTLEDNAAAKPVPSDGPNAYSANGSAGDITFDGGTLGGAPVSTFDTVSGGVGDYIIGGTQPHTPCLAASRSATARSTPTHPARFWSMGKMAWASAAPPRTTCW